MDIEINSACKNCFFHYCRDLEDDVCFEDNGCSGFSPIGLRLEDIKILKG